MKTDVKGVSGGQVPRAMIKRNMKKSGKNENLKRDEKKTKKNEEKEKLMVLIVWVVVKRVVLTVVRSTAPLVVVL